MKRGILGILFFVLLMPLVSAQGNSSETAEIITVGNYSGIASGENPAYYKIEPPPDSLLTANVIFSYIEGNGTFGSITSLDGQQISLDYRKSTFITEKNSSDYIQLPIGQEVNFLVISTLQVKESEGGKEFSPSPIPLKYEMEIKPFGGSTSPPLNIFGSDFYKRAFIVWSPFLFFLLIIILPIYIYVALALITIAKKTGTGNSWFAWIPILNFILAARIAKVSLWTVIPAFIPFVNVFIQLWWWWKIAEVRGKPGWLALLMLIPLLNFVILGILAWGKRSEETTTQEKSEEEEKPARETEWGEGEAPSPSS